MPLPYKAVTYTSSSQPLTLSEVNAPAEEQNGALVVGTNDILVKVKYAALNPIDSILKNSTHPWFAKGINIFGKDFSGDVKAIGADAASASSLEVGDRVAGVVQGITKNGSVGEYVLVNATDLTGKATSKIPEGLSYQVAAAVPLVLSTAYQAIEQTPDNTQFKKVLVLGASTSVGRFAVQLLKNVKGADEIVATCSGSSAEAIKGYGASSVIDYTRHQLLLGPVLESVKQSGAFDYILDCCGNNDLFGHMDTILRPKSEGGSYITVSGDVKYTYATASVLLTMKSNVTRPELSKLLGFVAEGKVKVDIDSEYALADFQAAVDRQLTNKAVGKVLVRI